MRDFLGLAIAAERGAAARERERGNADVIRNVPFFRSP